MITSQELRQKYLQFFEAKQHTILIDHSILPENDPTMLFVGAGMQPLVPYLGGNAHPSGKRLCNVQKCIRTIDIDEVGDSTHLTFFEMLGNWSLGDYFKEESIQYSFEFLTSPSYLALDLNKLAFSCYQGNDQYNVPKDEEAYRMWLSLGVAPERIVFLGDDHNWWPKMGMDGLCGPDTEIFYWVSKEPVPVHFDPEDDRWVEIWNNVFMQYKFQEGVISELQNKNVDTGMGLERTLVALNGFNTVYETDVFADAIQKLQMLSGKIFGNDVDTTRAMRIILDHIRAGVVMIADGVNPSNVDQGYILRRLLRRAIRQGKKLGIEQVFTGMIAQVFIDNLGVFYTHIQKKAEEIVLIMDDEEKKFYSTLEKGMKEFEKILSGFQIAYERTGKKVEHISGAKAFTLYDTYGFPIEMTKDLAQEHGLSVDEDGFHAAYERHREISRAGSEKKFAGGLADHSEETTKLHTATHLMLEALRRVLGDHVAQRGSNITADRLRFDFSHPEKLTVEQIAEVERLVNDQISKALPIHFEEMTVEQAIQNNATGVFVEKYQNDLGGKVKVYFMGDPERFSDYYSVEICGGPHAENTDQLGKFSITKEEASSSGVRRIKAILSQR